MYNKPRAWHEKSINPGTRGLRPRYFFPAPDDPVPVPSPGPGLMKNTGESPSSPAGTPSPRNPKQNKL